MHWKPRLLSIFRPLGLASSLAIFWALDLLGYIHLFSWISETWERMLKVFEEHPTILLLAGFAGIIVSIWWENVKPYLRFLRYRTIHDRVHDIEKNQNLIEQIGHDVEGLKSLADKMLGLFGGSLSTLGDFTADLARDTTKAISERSELRIQIGKTESHLASLERVAIGRLDSIGFRVDGLERRCNEQALWIKDIQTSLQGTRLVLKSLCEFESDTTALIVEALECIEKLRRIREYHQAAEAGRFPFLKPWWRPEHSTNVPLLVIDWCLLVIRHIEHCSDFAVNKCGDSEVIDEGLHSCAKAWNSDTSIDSCLGYLSRHRSKLVTFRMTYATKILEASAIKLTIS